MLCGTKRVMLQVQTEPQRAQKHEAHVECLSQIPPLFDDAAEGQGLGYSNKSSEISWCLGHQRPLAGW